jgi:hypothetical protein
MRITSLLVLLSACASMSNPDPVTPTPSASDPRLRAALKFKADGVAYEGATVLPRKPANTTKFEIILPRDSRMVFVNSCAREETYEPEGESFKYVYQAAAKKEDDGSCALLFTVITKGGEYHRAVVDFANGTEKVLPTNLFCNGKWVSPADGAGLCQVRATLPVSVEFKTPVVYSHRDFCPEPKCVSECKVINGVQVGKEFDIYTAAGFCGYGFENEGGLRFRLTTLGYTSILNLFPPLKGK